MPAGTAGHGGTEGMDTFELEMQRDRFLKIYDEQIGDREGKEALREWLLSDGCDFFTAPASTKYHGNYIHGIDGHRRAVP